MKFKKCDVIILVASIALLIIGAGVYFIFRTPIRIFEMLGITQYQIVVLETQNSFNYFLVYCSSDALWYMSLLLLQTFFLAGKGFVMTSTFSWQNSISLCPASFHIPRPNLPVTPGVS